MRNDVVRKQNLIDSLLEHNTNLLNHQCCQVIQATQSNIQSGINTDVTLITTLIIMELILTLNDKTNIQPTSYKKNDKSDLLDFYSNEYHNKVVLGDFNLEPSSTSMLSLMDSQNLLT